RHRSIPILIINVLARVSICLLCNLRKPTAVVLLKRVALEVKTLMGATIKNMQTKSRARIQVVLSIYDLK
ncbi:unnamed protein product, partial [Brassica oleracea]